jgi:hypothetical protein
MQKILLSTYLFYCFFFAKAQSWQELGINNNRLNVNGQIESITIDPKGNVYAAGDFADANNLFYVAKWNGTKWSELGTGNNALKCYGYILSITSDKSGNIYAAGFLTTQQAYYYVAVWNGTNWNEVGSGNNVINANGPIEIL